MAPSFHIEPLVLPSKTGSSDAADFLEFNELSDALILEAWGNLDLANPREARLESWRDDDYKQAQFYYVRLDGRMVARSSIGLPLAENLHVAMVRVDVLHEFTGRGLGRCCCGMPRNSLPVRAAPHCRASRNMPLALIPTGPAS